MVLLASEAQDMTLAGKILKAMVDILLWRVEAFMHKDYKEL